MTGDFLSRFGIGRLGAGAIAHSTALVIRAGIQAAALILLSRWMGASDYGMFAGVVAIVMLIAPLAGWGASVLAARRPSNEAHAPHAWSEASLQVVVVSALLLFLLMAWQLTRWAQHVPVKMLLLVGLTELLVAPLVTVAAIIAIANSLYLRASLVVCLVPLGRLTVLAAAVALGMKGTPQMAAYLHVLGSLIGALVAIGIVIARVDWLKPRGWGSIRRGIKDGTPYATGQMLASGYQEIDKVLLFSLLGATVLGPYAVAFRAASIFTLPAAALAGVMLPRLFKAAADRASNEHLMRPGLVSGCAYGGLASIGILLLSPLMPYLFGSSFSASADYLRWLSPWPLLFSIHHLAATGLTGMGKQSERLTIELLGFLVVLAGTFVLAGIFGAYAAIFSLLTAELLMGGLCIWRLRANQQPNIRR